MCALSVTYRHSLCRLTWLCWNNPGQSRPHRLLHPGTPSAKVQGFAGNTASPTSVWRLSLASRIRATDYGTPQVKHLRSETAFSPLFPLEALLEASSRCMLLVRDGTVVKHHVDTVEATPSTLLQGPDQNPRCFVARHFLLSGNSMRLRHAYTPRNAFYDQM